MKRFFKCMMSAVLALGVLSGAASAVPQTEEAAVSEEQTDDSAIAESAADLVSGESMVYLPSGMRAVMLTPTVDFYTGEQTDASLAEELPALFEELSGFDMNTVIFNTDHDGVKCYDLKMDSGRGAPAVYFEHGEQLFFDLSKQLLPDFDHIIIDNISRLPLEFLEEQFTDCPDAREAAAKIRSADGYEKRGLYAQLREIVSGNDRLFMRIQNRIRDSIELAKKRVSRNYKTAIPSYFPKCNTMSLMLPLCLTDEEKPDVALVVEQTQSGNYQGQTILTLDQAYIDARLLCRLNSEWLPTNISADEADEAEDSAE